MKKSCLLLSAVCFFVIPATTLLAQPKNLKAHLFDSYGYLNGEDASARLDNFAIELQNNLNVDAYVVCYGPQGQGSGTGNGLMAVTTKYFVDVSGIEPERIHTINAGRYKIPAEIMTELWLVPVGARPPESRHYENKFKPVNGKFADYNGWDAPLEGEGPSLGNVRLASFADALREQPDTTAYIVGFNLRGSAPGTWRRVAKKEEADLQGYGIAADRIKIIYGGTVKKREKEDVPDALVQQQAQMQFWILPSDAPPPVKKAKGEPTPKKATQIGSYDSYLLKYPKDERSTFNGFADVLRANDELNVYIITRPRIPDEEEDISPGEPPPIDLAVLAQKWKTELIEKSGINQNRVMVINATADHLRPSGIEVWVAPPGVPLPDIYLSGESPDK